MMFDAPKMRSGIYQIENQINGKRYIGSAVNLRTRWQNHLSALHRGGHRNRHLQRAFDKYGESVFLFTVLKYIEDFQMLIEREQYYFDTSKPEYNMSPTAGSLLGYQHTDEALTKMRAAQVDRQVSTETLAKMHAANSGEQHYNYGKHPSAVTKQKISKALTGKRLSNETKQKISAGLKAYWHRVRAARIK